MKGDREILKDEKSLAKHFLFTHIFLFNELPQINSEIIGCEFIKNILEEALEKKEIIENKNKFFINVKETDFFPAFSEEALYLMKITENKGKDELLEYLLLFLQPESVKDAFERIPEKYRNIILEEEVSKRIVFTPREVKSINEKQGNFPVVFFLPLRDGNYRAVIPIEAKIALRGEKIGFSKIFPNLSFLYRETESPQNPGGERSPLCALLCVSISRGIKINKKTMSLAKSETMELKKKTGISPELFKKSFDFIKNNLKIFIRENRLFLSSESFHLLKEEERFRRAILYILQKKFPFEFSFLSFLETERWVSKKELSEFYWHIDKFLKIDEKRYRKGKTNIFSCIEFLKNGELISETNEFFKFKKPEEKRGKIYIQSNGEVILTPPVRKFDAIGLSAFGSFESWKDNLNMKIKREVIINNRFRFRDENDGIFHLEKIVRPDMCGERIKNLLVHELKKRHSFRVGRNIMTVEVEREGDDLLLLRYLVKKKAKFLKENNLFLFKELRDYQCAVNFLLKRGISLIQRENSIPTLNIPSQELSKIAGALKYLAAAGKGSKIEDELKDLLGFVECSLNFEDMEKADAYFRKIIEEMGIQKKIKAHKINERERARKFSSISSDTFKKGKYFTLLIEREDAEGIVKERKTLKVHHCSEDTIEGWSVGDSRYIAIPAWWVKEAMEIT